MKKKINESPNVAVFTTTYVMLKNSPIVHVSHDDDDGCWQFIGPEGAFSENAMLVTLEEIVKLDPNIVEIADLPYGAHATRSAIGEKWHIYFEN